MALVCKAFGDIITFTRASSATFTGSNGLIQSATTNTPRFDYDPVTLAAKGLLIEEQRTNLLTYSQEFDNAIWAKGNITVTANASVAPDGTTTADKYEATTTTFTSGTRVVTATSTALTYSIYAKKGSGATDLNSFALRNSTTAINLASGTINYDTGVWTGSGSATVIVSDAGSGWWRIQIGASSGITVGDTMTVYVCATGNSETAGEFAFVWGAQLEAGAFATSYIPTVASQVTRNADVASVNTLSPWYNATEGTLFASVSGFSAGAAFSALAAITDNPVSSNWVQISGVTASTAATVVSGGVSQANLTSLPSVSSGGSVAIAYKANDFAAVVNGGTVATDVAGSVPSSVSILRIGGFGSNPGPINGHIRRITYYPRKLSSAELQAITA